MKIVIVLLLLILCLSFADGQQQDSSRNIYTISGHVRDSKTGEELIGATVLIKELRATGSVTNAYGFYSISIPAGEYTVKAQFVGYDSKSLPVSLHNNLKLDILLDEQAVKQDEVVIIAERNEDNTITKPMGMQKLSTVELQTIPVLLGEKDVLKTIQLIPGIKPVGEGSSGFYVRGGSSDQNLMLLDEAPVYSASHLFGFFSVFNSDAIKDVSIYKGDIPAQYGGRLSSVLDMKMKDGNNKSYGINGGIGLIASHLSVEGPLISDKGSFLIAGRRTYADLFLKLSNDTSINQASLYFYDLNAKASYRLDENNRIYASGYFGKDFLGFGKSFGFDWGNTTATLRWNHLFGGKMFSNTSLIYSNYDYTFHLEYNNIYDVYSRIRDYNFKQDFQYFADARNSFTFGFNSIYHVNLPGDLSVEHAYSTDELRLPDRNAWENALYLSHEFSLSEFFSFTYGARLTTFSVLGPGTFYTYSPAGERQDSSSYGSGTFINTYASLEPRISATYRYDEQSSFKASYGRTTQNFHLISNSTTENPTDQWIMTSKIVRPEIADQVSLGYFRTFQDLLYEFSTEIYYRSLQNQIDYKDGADLFFNQDIESQLVFGTGRAYGIEFFFKKKYGRLNGWIGYTLARTERQFAEINSGDYFPARQDRTHDISVVGIYQLSDTWSFSSTWVYYTGGAVTFPSGKYDIAGQVINYYTERNAYRLPPYHRLDLGATWQGEHSSWTFSLYNAYGRDNAYTITFRQSSTDPSRTEAVQTSLFKFVPSVTYNFKF